MPKPQLAPNVKKNRISSFLNSRYVPDASATPAQKREIKSILDALAESNTPEQIAGKTIQEVFASKPQLIPVVQSNLLDPNTFMRSLSRDLNPYRLRDVEDILKRYSENEEADIPYETIRTIVEYLNNAPNPNENDLINTLPNFSSRIKFKNSISNKLNEVMNDFKTLPTKESTRVSEEEAAVTQAREARIRERALAAEREAAQRREAERLAQLTAANQAANPIDTSTPQGQEAARRQEEAIRQTVSLEDSLRQQHAEALANESKRKLDERLARERNAAQANLKKAKKPTAAEAIQDLESKISAGETTSTQNMPAFHQEALRGLYKGAVRDVFNREYEPYLNERIAQKTPLQTLSQQRLAELDPFLGETKANQQNIIERIRGLDKDPAKTAIREYLNPASQTLGQAHEDLIGAEERAAEDVYRRRGMEHLQEDILPKIRNKYSPISHIHGGRDKELTRAVRNYGREIEDALSGMRLKNRAITVPAALQHREQQTKSGQALANAAISDSQHNMAAIEGLQKAQDATIGSKEKFINSLHGIGQAEQAREQQKNDLAYEQFKEQRDQGLSNLERFSNIIRGHHLPTASTSTNLLPPKFVASPYSAAGEIMSSNAANMMSQRPFKRGGRVTKADGGNISPLQDAINWSVIDRESPIDEMKRNVRRQQAMDMMGRLKNHRQMYAEGGAISPIEKGAMTANNIAMLEKSKQDRERFRAYNASKQIHQSNPWLTDVFRYGAAGVANSKSLEPYGNMAIPSGLHSSMRAMNTVFDKKDKERAAFEKAQQEAMDRDLGLLKDEEGIERDARKFDFETEKFKEQMALNRLMHQENVRHHTSMENLGREKVENKPLTDAEQKTIDKNMSKIMNWKKVLDDSLAGEELYKDLPTGGIIGEMALNKKFGGSYGAALASVVDPTSTATSPEKFRLAKGLSNSLVSNLKLATAEGGKTSNLMFMALQESKPNPDVDPEENMRRFGGINNASLGEILQGVHGLERKRGGAESAGLILDTLGVDPEDYVLWKKNPKKTEKIILDKLREMKRLERGDLSTPKKVPIATPSTQSAGQTGGSKLEAAAALRAAIRAKRGY